MMMFNSCPWSLVWLPILKYGGIRLPSWDIIIYILKWYKILSICQEIVDYDKIMIVTKKRKRERQWGRYREIENTHTPQCFLLQMYSLPNVLDTVFARSVWAWKQKYLSLNTVIYWEKKFWVMKFMDWRIAKETNRKNISTNAQINQEKKNQGVNNNCKPLPETISAFWN